ncbi:MAG: tetratricopeptide repeat protein [Candidatus Sulfopaludibacter sp.]|nr:tetratricopeptide repeat protein [Candidatus Sulfopaludibacter sp.]
MSPRNVVRAVTVSSAFLLLISTGFAQGRGATPPAPPSGTGAPTTGAGTGTVNIPTNPNTTNPSTGTKTSPGYIPPLYLTGRVMLENGTPPPEPVTIERVCNGNPHAEGYTDTNGGFGIQLGNESGVFQDASEENTRGSVPGMTPATGSMNGSGSGSVGSSAATGGPYLRYQNCEIRAKLAGYRSQSILLANRRSMDDPNIGTILLHKDGDEAGTLVSANSLAAPKDARKAYERGMLAVRKNKLDEASKEFEKAVALYPNHAEAWFELGRIQARRGQTDAARQSFDNSIKADPKFVSPYVQLSILSMEAKNWRELSELTDRAMRLDSFDYPQLFLFNAVANYNLHKFGAAETSLKQAVRLDTQHRYPDIQHLMGLVLILHKDYAGAAEQFRAFLKMAPDSPDAAGVRSQLAEMDRMTTESAAANGKDK